MPGEKTGVRGDLPTHSGIITHGESARPCQSHSTSLDTWTRLHSCCSAAPPPPRLAPQPAPTAPVPPSSLTPVTTVSPYRQTPLLPPTPTPPLHMNRSCDTARWACSSLSRLPATMASARICAIFHWGCLSVAVAPNSTLLIGILFNPYAKSQTTGATLVLPTCLASPAGTPPSLAAQTQARMPARMPAIPGMPASERQTLDARTT